ncbi:MAG: hypothetical protein IT179_21505 [Acidobacteria bacterium]|nr:hypothetical protein [Acidobacteriota bacterium]
MRTRLLALIVIVVLGAPLAAQDRPTVFVHGLNGSPGTWRAAADRLRATLAITTYVPGVPWAETFEVQAQSLQSQYGGLPATAIAIGHSNGGVAARQWSRLRNLSGVMTVGSPQQGTPAVDRLLSVLGFHEGLYNTAGAVFGLMGAQPNEWWDLYVFVELALRYAQGISSSSWGAIVGLGVLSQYPVVPQMSTRSAFLGQLNGSANLAREAAAVPARVGIAYELEGYWRMGPIRLYDRVAAETWYSRVWYAIGTLETAGSLLMTSYPSNFTALTIASRLFRVAQALRRIDPEWCLTVTNDATCRTPHDGIVPVWSQQYPGGRNLFVHGPSHLQEPQVSDGVISYGLTTHMGVLPRAGAPPPPPPPSSPSDVLASGDSLQPGESRRSSNGEFELAYQSDGNLVLYRSSDGHPLWASMTFQPGLVAMQADGNLVVYNASGAPQWSSGTAGNPGAWLAIQEDGNLVVYDYYGYPLWWRP